MSEIYEIHDIIRKQIQEPLWDNWYIKDELGRGASGVVYRIEARRENRVDVSALKIEPIVADESVYVDDARRLDYLEKKRLEAENETTIMYKLRSSPNIVLYEDETIKPLYHEGRQLGYYMLIRMERLTGLQKLIKARDFDASEKNILRLAIDIGSGIKAAHDIGVIHRDIKPGNFFVSEAGVYKLGDFNISKKSVSARSFAGTEGYIAPEIYRARYGVDGYTKQADIYSFGIALYCLSNDYQFPFGDVCLPEEAIERRMNGEPLPPPKNVSSALARIILKACAFNPGDRYSNMGEMLRDLKALEFESSEPTLASAKSAFATEYAGDSVTSSGDTAVFTTSGAVSAGGALAASSRPPLQQPKQPQLKPAFKQEQSRAPYTQQPQPQPQPARPQSQYYQPPPQAPVSDAYGTAYSQPAPPRYVPPPQYPSYSEPREKKGSAGPKIVIASLIVIVLAILGVVAYTALNGGSGGGGGRKSSSEAEPTTETILTPAETLPPETTTTATTATTTTVTTTAVTTTTGSNVIKLDPTLLNMKEGDVKSVTVKQYPTGSDHNDEKWRSTDPSVASVDEYGLVTALKAGSCKIILSMKNNPAAEASVSVIVSPKIDLPDLDLDLGLYGHGNVQNGGYACTDGSSMFYTDSGKLYSVSGGNYKQIASVDAHYMNCVGKTIYFCNAAGDNNICSIGTDGSGFKVIRSAYCYELTYYNDYLYFSEVAGNTHYICRMKPDGSDYARLRQVNCWYMCIDSGVIYYVNYDNGYSLDRMSTDGSFVMTLVQGETSDLCIYDGRIYYSADRNSRDLYSVNTIGGDRKLVREGYSKHNNAKDGEIYCTDDEGTLVTVDLSTGKETKYPQLGALSYPVIVEYTLFAQDEDGKLRTFTIS